MSREPIDIKINVTRQSAAPNQMKVKEAVGQAVQLLNTERTKANVPVLGLAAQLMQAAQEHCDDMAARGYLAPTTPEGEQVGTRAKRLGYNGRVTALLASGAPQLGVVLARWLTILDYKAVLLDAGYSQLGIGMADGAWTVLLALPAPQVAPAPAPQAASGNVASAAAFDQTARPGTPVPASVKAATAPPPADKAAADKAAQEKAAQEKAAQEKAADKAPAARAPDIRDVRSKAQELISQLRAQTKLGPVALSETLCNGAQAHADDMAARDYFATNSPDGSSAMARAQQRGFGGTIIASMCKGPSTPEDAFMAWRDSSLSSLLHPQARYIGIGSAGGRWVLLIGITV